MCANLGAACLNVSDFLYCLGKGFVRWHNLIKRSSRFGLVWCISLSPLDWGKSMVWNLFLPMILRVFRIVNHNGCVCILMSRDVGRRFTMHTIVIASDEYSVYHPSAQLNITMSRNNVYIECSNNMIWFERVAILCRMLSNICTRCLAVRYNFSSIVTIVHLSLCSLQPFRDEVDHFPMNLAYIGGFAQNVGQTIFIPVMNSIYIGVSNMD